MASGVELVRMGRAVVAQGRDATQSPDEWRDVLTARHLVITVELIDTSNLSSGATINVKLVTAPVLDPATAGEVTGPSFGVSEVGSVKHAVFEFQDGGEPLMRYIGWKVSTDSTTTGDVIFRMMVTVKD